MSRLLFAISAIALTTTLGTAEARDHRSGMDSRHEHHDSDFRRDRDRDRDDFLSRHGERFSDGYRFRGRDHHHWSFRRWFDDYGCYCYYCPYSSCYYFWCGEDDCYYPISYYSHCSHRR